MKFKTVAFLLITIIAVISSFAQEEIFFDCVPVDYNTTPNTVRIYNTWLIKDVIILQANIPPLDTPSYGIYLVEDNRAKFLFQSPTQLHDEILPTRKGFFHRPEDSHYFKFYNLNTHMQSDVIGNFKISGIRFEEKFYDEGLFYVPDNSTDEPEKLNRLHFTDGSKDNTFYFKEFQGYAESTIDKHISVVKCGERFFSTGRAQGEDAKRLWELDINNGTATPIEDFYISGEPYCHDNNFVCFNYFGATEQRGSPLVCIDLNTNEKHFFLEDSIDEDSSAHVSIIGTINDKLILERVGEVWNLDLVNDNYQLLTKVHYLGSRDLFKFDDFFLQQRRSVNDSFFFDDILLVSDGTAEGTFKIPFDYWDTSDGNWSPKEIVKHNNKIYFSAVRTDSTDFLAVKTLYEISKDTLKNLNTNVGKLYKVDNNLLFTSCIDTRNWNCSKKKMLWNYNNGEPYKLVDTFELHQETIHKNKLYLSITGVDNKVQLLETDGTSDGTKYILRNSGATFLNNEDILYFYRGGNNVSPSFYKMNETTNLLELISVPFPFTESSSTNIKIDQFTYETIYNTVNYYTDEDFGTVLYRKGKNIFFYDTVGLRYSNGAPSDSKLIPQITSGILGQPRFIEYQDKFWFIESGDPNQKLYSTDGTAEGTKLEYEPNFRIYYDDVLTNSKGFFFKDKFTDSIAFYNTVLDTLVQLPIRSAGKFDGVYKDKLVEIYAGDTKELHVSDGTIENTTVYYYGDHNVEPFLMDDNVLMIDLETNDLYNTDENYKPKDLLVNNFIDYLHYPMANGHMIFYTEQAADESKNELWVTDGTKQNTKKIFNRNLGTNRISSSSAYDPKNEVLYFIVKRNALPGPVYVDSLFYFDFNESKLYKANFYNSPSNKFDYIELIDDKIYIKGYNDLFGYEVFYLSKEPVDPLCMNKFLTGSVFYDSNNNGLRDFYEEGVPNISILQNDRDIYNIKTNEEGDFYAMVANGAFEISASTGDGCYKSNTKTYWVDTLNRYAKNLNFALEVSNDSIYNNALSINLTSAPTRCGFLVPLWITATNFTCDTVSGNLIISLDEKVGFVENENPDFTGSYSTISHALTFSLDNLPVFQQTKHKIILKMPDENFVGEDIIVKAALNDANNILENFTSNISCAIDPNDKLVSPNREDPENRNYTQLDEKLEYTIRFQNTGTDTAFNVKLIDTLSNKLNYSSLETISASHNYTFDITEAGILTFQFDNILLPDSNVNEVESHGFVTFSIFPKDNIVAQDEILNSAGIYFDFNQPIITNTVISTFVEFVDEDSDSYYFWQDCNDKDASIYENCDSVMPAVNDLNQKFNVKLFPNPTKGIFNVTFNKEVSSESINIKVKDITGITKQTIMLTPNSSEIQLDIRQLKPGLYFCEILLKDGRRMSIKTIKI